MASRHPLKKISVRPDALEAQIRTVLTLESLQSRKALQMFASTDVFMPCNVQDYQGRSTKVKDQDEYSDLVTSFPYVPLQSPSQSDAVINFNILFSRADESLKGW